MFSWSDGALGREFGIARRAQLGYVETRQFDLGAHPFLTLTLFIAMFERDHAEPLGFQLEYARRLADRRLPYPDITT